MGVSIYLRQAPYGGTVPQLGAKEAAWSATEAKVGAGSAVMKFGSSLQGMGNQMQAEERQEREREGQINEIRAEAALDEHVRTTLKESGQIRQTDDNGLWHGNLAEPWRQGYTVNGQERQGYDALKKALLDGLPEDRRGLWLARIESHREPQWQEQIDVKGRELREQYITAAATGVLRGPGGSGDILAVAAKRQQVQSLFEPDEWAEVSADVDGDIALQIAQYDPELADQYAREFMTPARHKKIAGKLETEGRAAQAQANRLREAKYDEVESAATLQTWQTIGGRAQPGREMTPKVLDFLLEKDQIRKPAYEGLMRVLLQDKPADQGKQDAAYQAVSTAYTDYKMNRKTKAEAIEVFHRNAANLQTEDREKWFDSIQSQEYDQRATALNFTESTGKKVLESNFLFDSEGKPSKIGELDSARLERAVGHAKRRLVQWFDAQEKAGKPVTEEEAKEQALMILLDEKATYEGIVRPRAGFVPVPEPKTPQEFISEVARLKNVDPKKAREYYDRWKGIF